MSRPRTTGWVIALVGVTLALVADLGYVTADDPAKLAPGVQLKGPTLPIPDRPQPAPLPDVKPIGPR